MTFSGYAALKVLVIDDFDNFRMTVGKMLEELGCRDVEMAMNGQQALHACQNKSYDLVLCDYNLGSGPNGQQVLEALRAKKRLQRQSLFLLVSAESSKSIVLSAYDYAPDAYLTKPITGKSLQQRLDRLLCQRQEMLPVYVCLTAGDVDGAVSQSQAMIQGGSRYASAYQKLLGELYLQHQRLDEAEQLYKQTLEIRPLDWAQVGMARVKSARDDLATSNQWLNKIIEKNPFCMQAYDALVDNYRQQHQPQQMQQALQAAVAVSPMSIVRQSSLAVAAQENNDLAVAAKAFGRSVRLGENSCYDCLENHLQFGRTTAALLREGGSTVGEMPRESLRVLGQVAKRFDLSREQGLQTKLLECQLHAGRGDEKRALDILQEVNESAAELALGLDVQLDKVSALRSLGQTKEASELLKQLVDEYEDDQQALQKIDLCLEEPVSEKNSKLVARLNNEGIGYYQNQQYAQALESFMRAQRLFPNHIGVHLNLAQALIAEMREFGRCDERMQSCLQAMKKVESNIGATHPQFARYRQLHDMLRTLGRD